MKLSQLQAQSLIKTPKNKTLIEKGKKYESALRILTEAKFKDYLEKEEAWPCFLDEIKKKVSAKKFERITQFIKYPLPVVNIGKGVLKDIYKIFDSMNSYFHVEYMNKNGQQSISSILDQINVHNWLVHEGKEALMNKPNSIILVDKNLQGEPYLICINSDRLVDVSVKDDSTLDYIVFVHSVINNGADKTIFYGVYDDDFYRIYKSFNGSDPELELEIAHKIGYCPARMLLSEPMNSEDSYNRSVPLTDSISKLEEWQQFDIFTYYVKHYGAFPIIERPSEDCSVNGCKNGVVYEDYIDDAGVSCQKHHKCDVCAEKKVIGPGTEINVKPKRDKDDVDTAGMFRFIDPGVEILKYLQENLETIKSEVYLDTIGESEVIKLQAVNDTQVTGSFESKKNILIYWKEHFDSAYKWIIETVVKTYNPNLPIMVHANFGTEFYLQSEDSLQLRYDTAKKAGMSHAELDMIYSQLLETKYRGNPNKLKRMKIIALLDPLPHETTEDAILKRDAFTITDDDLVIKTRLISFVNRFETENGSIVEFGKDIELAKKIETIKQTFKSYIDVKPKPNPAQPVQ